MSLVASFFFSGALLGALLRLRGGHRVPAAVLVVAAAVLLLLAAAVAAAAAAAASEVLGTGGAFPYLLRPPPVYMMTLICSWCIATHIIVWGVGGE